ncbi:MAG TPA: GDP-mannose 4,6-dehydratase, partial [Planctomycetia bacterium]|nr:GDP-mannose 4,6-dehydratase [Planctomycetia bacterium]
VCGFARGADWAPGADVIADRIEVRSGDIADEAALVECFAAFAPDEIYHLAGFASVPQSVREPEETRRVNAQGARAVFAAAAKACPKARILAIGTGAVYGKPKPEHLPITEATPVAPASPYAESKLEAERIALSFAERGLHVVAARPFNHIGPRQHGEFVIAEFVAQIVEIERGRAESVLRCGDLDLARDFTDVRDVCAAYRLLMAHGKPGEIFNVASGAQRTLRSLLDDLLGMTKVPIEIRPDPAKFRRDDPRTLEIDVKRLRDRTGWRPAVPIERTLAETLEHARRNLP